MSKYLLIINFCLLSIFIKAEKNDTIYINSLLKYHEAFSNKNVNDYIIKYFKALELSKKINYKFGIAESNRCLGNAYLFKKDYDFALSKLKIAVNEFDLKVNSKNLTSTYTNIATIYSRISLNDSSLHYFNIALDIANMFNHLSIKATILNNLAIIFYKLGDYNQSLSFLIESTKISEELNEIDNLADTYSNIGIILEELNRDSLALTYYLKSYNIEIDKNNHSGIGTSLNLIGLIYMNNKKYNDAKSKFDESIQWFKKVNDFNGLAEVYNNLGLLFDILNNKEVALGYFEKSVSIKSQLHDDYSYSLGLLNLANEYLLINNLNKAEVAINKCIELADSINAIDILLTAYKNKSAISEKRKDFESSLVWINKYISLNDSIKDVDLISGINEIEAKYSTEKKQLEIENLTNKNLLKDEKLEKQKLYIVYTVAIILLFGIFLILVLNLYRKGKNKNKLLQAQNKIIETINSEITDSINYAKRIQAAILPKNFLHEGHISSSFIFYKPKNIVSGDFYFIAHTSTHSIYAVGDCTGHGVPGAFMSMLGFAFLSEIINKKEITQTNQVLNLLREYIINSLNQSGKIDDKSLSFMQTVKDGMDMSLLAIEQQVTSYESQVTESENINSMALSEVEMSRPKYSTKVYNAQYSGANNPIYIVSSQESLVNRLDNNSSTQNHINTLSHQLYELKGDKMPISIHERMDSFTSNDFELNTGDVVYMFSDGFPDQFGGEMGKKYMYKKFKTLLLNTSEQSILEQKDTLNNEYLNWTDNEKYCQNDDITILGIMLK